MSGSHGAIRSEAEFKGGSEERVNMTRKIGRRRVGVRKG
jgi:hypothetical protein